MSEKSEKRFLLLASAVVAVLILALLFVLLRGQNGAVVYRISIITDGGAEEYWKQFRRGVDQATLDYSVDVHFLSPTGDRPGDQQLELLAREIEAGADAVILCPLDAEKVKAWLEENQPGCPVVTVGCPLDSTRQTAFVGADNAALGEALAAALGSAGELWAVYEAPMSSAVAERYVAFKAAVEAASRSVTAVQLSDTTFYAGMQGDVVIAALDPQSAEIAVAGVRDAALDWPVYGIGSTNQLIGELERGNLRAIAVQSDYDVGYLSIRAVVAALDTERLTLAPATVYTVDAQNMFDDRIARILIPVS